MDTDSDPVWSVDGKRIAFVRRPAEPRDTPAGYFLQPDKPHPWAIWIADVSTANAHEIWHSSASPDGSYPFMAKDTGGGVIRWAAENRLLVASEQDGWQHLYSLSVEGGTPRLLTPGNCEVEQWSLTPDKKSAGLPTTSAMTSVSMSANKSTKNSPMRPMLASSHAQVTALAFSRQPHSRHRTRTALIPLQYAANVRG